MSIISNRHTVNPFVAGKSEALMGQRLAKIGYKKTANMPNPLPSVCVSVPQIDPDSILGNINRLLPYIADMLEGTQDKVIRSLYEASHGSLLSVSDDELSMSACIGFLETESSGSRLTVEFLESWFDSQCKDNLTVVIADKLGFDLSTPEQEKTVEKHVNGYRGLITSLSGSKTILQPNQIKACRTVIGLVSDDSVTVSRLTARLDAMEKKEKIEDLLEL